jgi:5,10-methylenetetrahydromethanopterin reductase
MPKPTFGVIFRPSFPSDILADYARRAEAAGFDELWLWDDCFLPGGFTSAAVALSATRDLKVGIGLLPATAYNPLFAAMEITTLALAFPGRILPGFGHGVADWLTRIGAPPSSLQTLAATVTSVRGLLKGEELTTHAGQVNLEKVQMSLPPKILPPLYVGAMRAKTLHLAGRVADGVILTALSSPAYVGWARQQIAAGMAETGRTGSRLVVYTSVKVNPDGQAARAVMRKDLAAELPWPDVYLQASGLTAGVAAFCQGRDASQIAAQMPDEWVDLLSAAGTPQQALASLQRLAAAGADSIIFQPGAADPGCLEEYHRYLMPLIKSTDWAA